MKQCKFYDVANETYLGGILTEDNEIICGCCGGKIYLDNEQYEIIEIYPNWVDLTDEIIGN